MGERRFGWKNLGVRVRRGFGSFAILFILFFLVCGSRAGPGPGPSPGNGTGPLRCKVARRSVPAYGEAG